MDGFFDRRPTRTGSWFFGGATLENFAFTLMVGVIVGTYSSIYTASATALLLDVNAQDLLEPVKDPDLIDDLP